MDKSVEFRAVGGTEGFQRNESSGGRIFQLQSAIALLDEAEGRAGTYPARLAVPRQAAHHPADEVVGAWRQDDTPFGLRAGVCHDNGAISSITKCKLVNEQRCALRVLP